MSSAGVQNLLMFCGAMAVVVAFWLLILGFINGSPLQLAGAVAAVLVAVFCFRAYAAKLRAERKGRDS